jgi:hypothetical protein
VDTFGSDDSDAEGLDDQDDRNFGPLRSPSTASVSLESSEQHGLSVVRPSEPSSSSFLSFWRSSRSTRGPSTNNDGVFANLSAKPEAEKPESEENPPSYEEAAADATPPYWETTVLTPGLSDELFIDGLPVGSPINFAWNMIVSSAFQFVGFFLTYLLHTSHAAKQGSRAGLGLTLLQCGFYLQPESDPGDSANPGDLNEFEPSNPNDFDVSTYSSVSGTFSQGHSSNPPVGTAVQNSAQAAGWISTLLMIIGVLIILKSIADYFQARRMELAVLRSSTNEEADETEEASTPPPPTPAEAAV